MPNDAVSPVSSDKRIEILDVLRGLAVCGILVGNMQWFSGYGGMPPELMADQSLIDRVTVFLVHFFVEGKFYSIFSFLFGLGFAIHMTRADERDDASASLFKRRLFLLLIIGLLHAYLLWAGDILSIYAVMGFVLLLLRRKSNTSLLKWAFAMMAVPIVSYTLLFAAFVLFAPPDTAVEVHAAQVAGWTNAINTVAHGSYYDILTGYNLNFIVGRYLGLIFDMRLPKILAMFLLGFYAYRIGVFQNLSEHKQLVRKVMIYGLALGIIGNAIMATLSGHETSFPPSLAGVGGVIGYAFGVPALALGIIAAVATLWQNSKWKDRLAIIAPVGRMALTNYLMHTIICVTVFYGYGFGLFGQFRPIQATLLAFAIFAFQIVASNVWLRYFYYGPMEWIWRELTYMKRLELRRRSVAS